MMASVMKARTPPRLVVLLSIAPFHLLILTALTSLPLPLLAGDLPLDNSGRVLCNAKNLAVKGKDSTGISNSVPRELQVGETRTIPAVCPAERYFQTGVIITPGAEYLFDSQGLWSDGGIVTDSDGWSGLFFQAWNRIPWRRFFLLSGSIGKSERHLFSIGRTRVWQAPTNLKEDKGKEIFLFANDWPGKKFIENNRAVPDTEGGPLRVSIRRLR